jgi:hypothetical protein
MAPAQKSSFFISTSPSAALTYEQDQCISLSKGRDFEGNGCEEFSGRSQGMAALLIP